MTVKKRKATHEVLKMLDDVDHVTIVKACLRYLVQTTRKKK